VIAMRCPALSRHRRRPGSLAMASSPFRSGFGFWWRSFYFKVRSIGFGRSYRWKDFLFLREPSRVGWNGSV